MNPVDLRACRSLLFLPASNPRAVAKARELGADMIILDLEDAVRPADKADARSAAVTASIEGFGGRPLAIRVNAIGTEFYGEDVVAVRRSAADYVVLAKAESAKQVADAAWLIGKPVLAMVETPGAVIEAASIAAATRGLIAGVNDLGAALGLPMEHGRAGLVYALQRILLSARAADVAAFDGVCNDLSASDRLAEECEEGRRFGFDGKSVIHPSQIETVNRAFAPSQAEIDAALRLIAAANGGAERHDGRMIEQLHVDQAQRLLAKGNGISSASESLATRKPAP